MKHAIFGGGNIGTLILAELSKHGYDTVLYSPHPEKWGNKIEVYDHDAKLCFLSGSFQVTDSFEAAVCATDMIWITYPAALFQECAERMLPCVKPGQVVVVIPGSGGAEFAFCKLLEKGCSLVGLERVHSIARLKEYGHSVFMLGRKPDIGLASIPSVQAYELASFFEALFEMPCRCFPNYLNVTLVPSNPILHTTRLYSLFKDYSEGKIYERVPFFYEDWNDESSEMLIACDQELQALCRSLAKLDLRYVKSLQDHYESHSVQAMTEKITSIPAFKGLTTPVIQSSAGWVPDFTSRYFKSDFSYGLKIVKDIGGLAKVPIPNIDMIWDWYISTTADSDYFSLENISVEDFSSLYLR